MSRSTFPGWERHYSGLSDSDLPSMGQDPLSLSHTHAHRMHRSRRGHLSPDKDVLGDLGDSDMESNASVTSSVFSTQSERPRGSRALMWVWVNSKINQKKKKRKKNTQNWTTRHFWYRVLRKIDSSRENEVFLATNRFFYFRIRNRPPKGLKNCFKWEIKIIPFFAIVAKKKKTPK